MTANDLQQDLTAAAEAVRTMPDHPDADTTVTTVVAVEFSAATPAAVLQEAAEWTRRAPGCEIHSAAWAREPALDEDPPECRLTVTVRFP